MSLIKYSLLFFVFLLTAFSSHTAIASTRGYLIAFYQYHSYCPNWFGRGMTQLAWQFVYDDNLQQEILYRPGYIFDNSRLNYCIQPWIITCRQSAGEYVDLLNDSATYGIRGSAFFADLGPGKKVENLRRVPGVDVECKGCGAAYNDLKFECEGEDNIMDFNWDTCEGQCVLYSQGSSCPTPL